MFYDLNVYIFECFIIICPKSHLYQLPYIHDNIYIQILSYIDNLINLCVDCRLNMAQKDLNEKVKCHVQCEVVSPNS